MKNRQGYFSALTGIILGFIIISLIAFYSVTVFYKSASYSGDNLVNKYQDPTFGLKQYSDHDFGFSFWYPANWEIKEGTAPNPGKFPKNKIVKYIRVGAEGNVYVFEVSSVNGSITDNPGPAPFPPINYFWDAAGKKWMVAWPEGNTMGQSSAPSPASTTARTMSGLFMFHSPSRFNTSIIPLSQNKFVVISDGGGANADFLAKTVTPIGGSIDSPGQTAALKAEAAAYAGQQ